MESAFKHAVRLEAYDKAVDDRSDQQRTRGGRARNEDGLARKVMALEQKLEQTGNRKSAVPERTAADQSMEDLKREMTRLAKQNDELSKEVGRLRLLEEKTRKVESTNGGSATAAEVL